MMFCNLFRLILKYYDFSYRLLREAFQRKDYTLPSQLVYGISLFSDRGYQECEIMGIFVSYLANFLSPNIYLISSLLAKQADPKRILPFQTDVYLNCRSHGNKPFFLLSLLFV